MEHFPFFNDSTGVMHLIRMWRWAISCLFLHERFVFSNVYFYACLLVNQVGEDH